MPFMAVKNPSYTALLRQVQHSMDSLTSTTIDTIHEMLQHIEDATSDTNILQRFFSLTEQELNPSMQSSNGDFAWTASLQSWQASRHLPGSGSSMMLSFLAPGSLTQLAGFTSSTVKRSARKHTTSSLIELEKKSHIEIRNHRGLI